jgi:hypothetical protein
MREIRILCRSRLRRIPERFSWVNQRFVTDAHMRRLSVSSLGLYLFLVTVGNHQGISWYGDERIREETGLSQPDLESARRELIDRDLLAFEVPFYQILSLPVREPLAVSGQVVSANGPVATSEEVATILSNGHRKIMGGKGSC